MIMKYENKYTDYTAVKTEYNSHIDENRMSRMMREIRAEIARLRPVISYDESDIEMVRKQAGKIGNIKMMADPEGWYVAMVLSGYLTKDKYERLKLADTFHEHMTKVPAGLVYTNPYYNNVMIPEDLTLGNHHFAVLRYERGEIIELNPDKVEGMYVPHYGYLQDAIEVPCITEDKPEESVWMSLSPGEIITMEDDISDAHGRVLTLGLGLGYYAYMAARKTNVSEVTVVERDHDTITLFDSFIRNQFGKDEAGHDISDKIRIVQADAFDYLRTIGDGDYDYMFADLWEGPYDGKPMYKEIKKITEGYKKTECRYWILPQMLSI